MRQADIEITAEGFVSFETEEELEDIKFDLTKALEDYHFSFVIKVSEKDA